jgi:hypothetical protein
MKYDLRAAEKQRVHGWIVCLVIQKASVFPLNINTIFIVKGRKKKGDRRAGVPWSNPTLL